MIAQPVRPHPDPWCLLETQSAARNILDNPTLYYVLDTETTALDGECVEIALLGVDGRVAFSSLVYSTQAIEQGAFEVHGINQDILGNAPTWPLLAPAFEELVRGRRLLIYNAPFDLKALDETYKRWALPAIKFSHTPICVMRMYAKWFGQRYQWGYRSQKLVGGDHTALGDCRATLELIKRMAVEE